MFIEIFSRDCCSQDFYFLRNKEKKNYNFFIGDRKMLIELIRGWRSQKDLCFYQTHKRKFERSSWNF